MTPCIVYPYAYYMFVGRKQHAYLISYESTTIAARRKGHATEILILLQDACLVARRLQIEWVPFHAKPNQNV